MVPFFLSVQQNGIIQPGDSEPSAGEIDVPFVEKSQLDKMFKRMMEQRKAQKIKE